MPPVLTRLGSILFSLGFTWFKDWYFAEGLMGGVKLQAEKPLNEKEKKRQVKALVMEVKDFLEKNTPNKKTTKKAREFIKSRELP